MNHGAFERPDWNYVLTIFVGGLFPRFDSVRGDSLLWVLRWPSDSQHRGLVESITTSRHSPILCATLHFSFLSLQAPLLFWSLIPPKWAFLSSSCVFHFGGGLRALRTCCECASDRQWPWPLFHFA